MEDWTIDGDQPRLRPVSPVRTDGFTVYVANLRSYHKTGEIAANTKVELCYLDDQHDQVRITGVAETVRHCRAFKELKFVRSSRYGEGLASLRVVCNGCKRDRPLSDLVSKDALQRDGRPRMAPGA